MKIRMLALTVLFILCPKLHAQTTEMSVTDFCHAANVSCVNSTPKQGPRVTLGGSTGVVYDNITGSAVLGVEVPLRRFEVDVQDIFSPYEQHVGLGSGTSNSIRGMGILWVANSFGLTGGVKYSEYSVSIHKSAYHIMPGILFRKSFGGIPSRFELNYVRQIDNVYRNGQEPNRLQGGRFAMTSRLGCSGPFCYRLDWETEAGRVHLQGNPQCDGTLPGPVTCPSQYRMSGGAKIGFAFEFPRRRGAESEAF